MNNEYNKYESSNIVPQNRYQLPEVPVIPRLNFRLESQHEDFIHKPEERQFSFYQICQFPINKKYMIRKLIYDEYGELMRYSEKRFEKDVLNKFIKKWAKHKYTIYPTYDLDVVGFPEPKEILMANSQLLNDY